MQITIKFIFIVFILLSAKVTNAQNLRINLYGAYVFNNSFDSYFDPTAYYRGKINGGFQWGTGIEYKISPVMGFELLYLRHDTKAPITYFQQGVKFTNFDMGANYIMAAGVRYLKLKQSPVELYGGALAGVAIFGLNNPDNGNKSSKTHFAWGARIGSNIMFSKNAGFKLQAQLLSAVQSVGGSFYFGTNGSGAGVATYSSIYQFGLGGGIFFNLPTGSKTN